MLISLFFSIAGLFRCKRRWPLERSQERRTSIQLTLEGRKTNSTILFRQTPRIREEAASKPLETGFAAPAIERRKKAQVDSFLPLPLQPPQSGPNPLPHLPRSAFKRPSSSGQLQEEEGRRIGGRSWDGGRGRTMIAPSSLTPSRRRKGKGGPPLPLSGEKEARYGIRLISFAQLQKLFLFLRVFFFFQQTFVICIVESLSRREIPPAGTSSFLSPPPS